MKTRLSAVQKRLDKIAPERESRLIEQDGSGEMWQLFEPHLPEFHITEAELSQWQSAGDYIVIIINPEPEQRAPVIEQDTSGDDWHKILSM